MGTAQRMILGTVAVAAILAGCGTTSVDDTGALVGSWGGPDREVTASTSEMVVSMPCIRFRLQGPVQVASDGSFAATGFVSGTSWLGGVGTPARASGVVFGNRLILGIEWQDARGQWPSAPSVSTLVRGEEVTWPDGRTCLA